MLPPHSRLKWLGSRIGSVIQENYEEGHNPEDTIQQLPLYKPEKFIEIFSMMLGMSALYSQQPLTLSRNILHGLQGFKSDKSKNSSFMVPAHYCRNLRHEFSFLPWMYWPQKQQVTTIINCFLKMCIFLQESNAIYVSEINSWLHGVTADNFSTSKNFP